MQLHDHESYFILPAEKQPAARPPRTALMTGVLVLVTMLIMVLVALAMGVCWDSLTSIR